MVMFMGPFSSIMEKVLKHLFGSNLYSKIFVNTFLFSVFVLILLTSKIIHCLIFPGSTGSMPSCFSSVVYDEGFTLFFICFLFFLVVFTPVLSV